MAAIGIHHVALTINNWEVSKAFYENLFSVMGAVERAQGEGLPHKENGRWCVYSGDGFMVTLWEAKKELQGNRFQMYNVGLHHVAFAASSREDVDALFQALKSSGAEILSGPEEQPGMPGYYAMYFLDPNGIKIEYLHLLQ